MKLVVRENANDASAYVAQYIIGKQALLADQKETYQDKIVSTILHQRQKDHLY